MRIMYRSRRGGYAALAAVVFISCAWLANSAGMQDAGWLANHANRDGHYYEGLLDQPNAKQEYEVIGFFAYGTSEKPRLEREPEPNSTLQAWFYDPEAGRDIQSKKLVIRAKQIASRTNYLLESMPKGILLEQTGWAHFSWETDPFIRKYHINPNSLGVVAQLETNDPADAHLFPVVFSLSCKDERIDHYELMLKIQRYSLAELSYDVGPRDGGGGPLSRRKSCYFTSSDPCGPHSQKIEVGTVLELPFSVDAADPRPMSLHISGHYQNSSEGIDVTYRFFHQPRFQCQ